jgi:hypothetical protein
VCGNDSTVNIRLVGMQIFTAVLVSVTVRVWDRQYGKLFAGGSADWFSGVGEG